MLSSFDRVFKQEESEANYYHALLLMVKALAQDMKDLEKARLPTGEKQLITLCGDRANRR
ncbi:hypothetical protein E5D57_003111 [Metarhizium anisopliae]|nr:hypothetical protein E5D57_003111 [Metarhizium anisopliae]